MATTSKLKDGRSWVVNSNGIKTLKRKYVVILDEPLSATGETASFTGVPAIGTAFSASNPNLKVVGYDVEEGTGTEKRTLIVTANYEYTTLEVGGTGEATYNGAVEEWGWDAGTEEKELTTAADGVSVLNSAGDPFESVPTVSAPAPVFTKVMKFSARQSGAMDHNCKVNASAITIGDKSCPAGSLLCTCAEQRIFGDADWKYRYTIQLKFKSNPVKIAGASTATDIGWDVSITDAGMREKDSSTGKLKLIRQIDTETGKLCTVTSPELLNGSGSKVTRSTESNPTPYNFRFKAYETTSFPGWFYSEPS